MVEREGYIPGVPCWVDTLQPDPRAAAEFYAGLLGWEFEDVTPSGAAGSYLVARLHGGDVAAVGAPREGAPPVAAWNTYVWVDSADEAVARAREAGGSPLSAPADLGGLARVAMLADPEGAVIGVWQAKGHRGARVVNEPGTVSFNDLNTRDPEGARVFYGSLFGWGTLEQAAGYALWTLPGYGDHLETIDPGVRERVAALGAPPDFADVVATLNPMEGRLPADVPPHWGVTFRVDDADATAARAAALGATVVAAPFDAPWVRMTVITDPQGATFVATRFAPENQDLAGPEGGVGGA